MGFERKKADFRPFHSHVNVLATTPHCAPSWGKGCETKVDPADTWGVD